MRIVTAMFGANAALLFAISVPGRAAPSPSCESPVNFHQELCDPGHIDVLSSHFDLFAKARTVSLVGADPASGLPSQFTAYVFDTKADPSSGLLAPPVWHIPQRYPETRDSLGTMRFDLHNLLPAVWNNTFMINGLIPAGNQPINLHTHGLLVLPHDSHEHGQYGDFVGVLGCPSNTAPSCPDDASHMQMTEICGFAKSAAAGQPCAGSGHAHVPGASVHGHEVLFGTIPYAIAIPGRHPASFNWFHPHAHEISSPQVGAGLAGVITIGSLCSDPTLSDASRQKICTTDNGEAVLNDTVRERVLMLKDFQVYDRRPGGKPDPGDDIPSAEGYRIVPVCTFDAGPPILKDGFCAFDPFDTTAPGGHWLFTVNGQIQPTIPMESGRPEIWRIANTSSNATYRLSLCTSDPKQDQSPNTDLAVCNSDAETKRFQILSLDGGLRPGSGALSSETEVLLLPGARAEILIAPATGEALRLVQKGFIQPDLYPPVILATTTTVAGTGTSPQVSFVSAETVPAQQPAESFEKPVDCEYKPAALGPADWVSLPTKEEIVSVFFGRVSDDPEVLTLGIMRGNPELSGDPAVVARIEKCLADANPDSVECASFKGSPFTMEHRNLCLQHGTTVTFRLYNFTSETHNFHMHQQKFEVSSAMLARVMNASLAAAIGSHIQRAQLGGAAPSSPGSPVVDSVPVPPIWPPDNATSPVPPFEVTMRFDKSTQIGDFVFHCHILEHEDKGMMKRITVYTQDRH